MYNYPTPKYTPDVKILILEETYWETARVEELLCKGVCRLLLPGLEAHDTTNEAIIESSKKASVCLPCPLESSPY